MALDLSPEGNARGLPGRKGGRRLSYYMLQKLEEQLPDNTNRKMLLANKIIDKVLSDDISTRDFLDYVSMILDRLEGKAVQTNINADVSTNPFDGIPTEKLEALKKKIIEVLPIPPENQIEKK